MKPIPAADISPADDAAAGDGSGPVLRAVAVSRSFGGVRAVSDVSLELRPGEVHGLIGPNGSGKTTFLNLLSGYYSIDEGRIRLGDDDITGLDVQSRVRRGVSRTFQKPRLLKSLSVLDNAMLGGWPGTRAGFLETALALPRPRREEREIRARATAILEAVGLGYALRRRADLLEHAEQRFLEIARALMTQPRFVLLDEPAGGLTEAEIESLGHVVGAVAAAGVGVLLVEHHTDFVFRLCDRVTVLDTGSIIAHGRPEVVRAHADVIRVYLGS